MKPEYWNEITDVQTAQSRILSHLPFAPSLDLVRMVSKIVPSGSILDFGCGIGRNFSAFEDFYLTVSGYDLPNMIDLCKTLHKVDLFDNWDEVSTRSYDLIFCCIVLQHIPMGNLMRYLRDFYHMTDKLLVYGRVTNDYFKDTTIRNAVASVGWKIDRILVACPNWENRIEDHEGILWIK